VEITYDLSIVSYEDLLDTFWKIHDPTSINRQVWDLGTQYRSAIFYFNDEQRALAMSSKETLEKSGKFKKPIATEITPATEFYEAEEYHQQYHEKNRKRYIFL
jgi:peptide-methionine (S)-S-oxide reductase